ncbi:hypothetical protein FRC03_007158 [Tulasnella sp. 419]|nr:hypothetical protein FRC03_007158 [Tulasnella sp. 419]
MSFFELSPQCSVNTSSTTCGSPVFRFPSLCNPDNSTDFSALGLFISPSSDSFTSSTSTLLSLPSEAETLQTPSPELVGKRWAAIYQSYYAASNPLDRLQVVTPPHEILQNERSKLILSYKSRLADAGAPYRRRQLHSGNDEEWENAEKSRRVAVRKALSQVVREMRGIVRNNQLLFSDWEAVANKFAKEFGLPGKVDEKKMRKKEELTYLDLYQYGKLGNARNVAAGKILRPETFKGEFAQGPVADPKKDSQLMTAYETALCAAKDRRVVGVSRRNREVYPAGISLLAKVVKKGRFVTVDNEVQSKTPEQEAENDEDWEDWADDCMDNEEHEDVVVSQKVSPRRAKTYVYEWTMKKCIGNVVIAETSGSHVLGKKRPSLLTIGRSDTPHTSVSTGVTQPGYIRQVEGACTKAEAYLRHRKEWYDVMKRDETRRSLELD